MIRPARIWRTRIIALAVTIGCMMGALGAGAGAADAQLQYYGANVHSLQMWNVSDSQMTQELNALQSAGANVLRVDVSWSALEPTQGQYNQSYQSRMDEFFAACQQRGIKVIAAVAATPSWASSGGQWNDAPSDPSDYGSIAQYIVARYGSDLAAMEAWNEPNNTWSPNLITSDIPGTYAKMLKAFYTGVKEANSSVPVLAGSMAYADLNFLKQLYADGIKGYYDGISVHPYSDGAAPGDLTVTNSYLGQLQKLHEAQLAAGDHTPIWITEFGWTTGNFSGANTDQQAAQYTEQAFNIATGLSYVKGATVYQLRDEWTDPTQPEDNFGLLRQDFTPRPAYAAFQSAMHSMASDDARGRTPTALRHREVSRKGLKHKVQGHRKRHRRHPKRSPHPRGKRS